MYQSTATRLLTTFEFPATILFSLSFTNIQSRSLPGFRGKCAHKQYFLAKKHYSDQRLAKFRTSTSNAEYSDHLLMIAIPKTFIYDIMLAARRQKVREIMEAKDISQGSVVSKLNNHLGLEKLSAERVISLLTIWENPDHVITSNGCLALFNRNRNTFLDGFITGFNANYQRSSSIRGNEILIKSPYKN